MDFIRNLFGGSKGSTTQASDSSDKDALWFYVECGKCGAPLAIRVDPRYDVSTDYETGSRYLRKEMMDSTCFRLMYMEVKFDGGGKISEQTVQGGKFLTRDEYETARAAFEAKKIEKR
jgi:hypothetical protein